MLSGIPFFGSMIRHSHMFQFSSLMSVILKSGAPTHDALVLCQSEALWPVLKDVVKKVELDVAEGGLFSEALAIRGVFSRTFLWLASIGEQRGDLGDSLRAAAEFERERIRDGVVMLGSWFEPALVTLTSVGIGFLVIALGPSLAFFT